MDLNKLLTIGLLVLIVWAIGKGSIGYRGITRRLAIVPVVAGRA